MELRLLVAAVAQLFDLGTFAAMVERHGPTAEANPLIFTLLVHWGLPMVAVAKVSLITLVSSASILLYRTGTRRSRWLSGAVIAVAIVAGIIGGGSNALVIGTI